MCSVSLQRKNSGKLVPGFLWTSLDVSFCFADFDFYHLAVINLDCAYNYMLSSASPPRKSLKLLQMWFVGPPTQTDKRRSKLGMSRNGGSS